MIVITQMNSRRDTSLKHKIGSTVELRFGFLCLVSLKKAAHYTTHIIADSALFDTVLLVLPIALANNLADLVGS